MANPLTNIFSPLFYDGDADSAKAQNYLKDSTGAYDNLRNPDLAPISLEDLIYDGDLDPSLLDSPANVERGADVSFNRVNANTADLARLGPSAMEGVSADPRLRDYQMQSLAALKDISEKGLSASDEAALNRIRSDAAQGDKARRESILQNARMRGVSGSGDELLAQLTSSQAATDRQAQEGMDLAAQMEARKIAAIQSLGTQGGALRSQDFDEASRVAAARDAINSYNTSATNANNQYNAGVLNQNQQFNAANAFDADRYNTDRAYDASKTDIANQQNAAQFNAATQNQTNAANREAREGIAKANADIHNQQTAYNAAIPQTQFDNAFKVASGKSNSAAAGTQYYGQKQATAEAAKGNMLGSFAGLGAAAIMASDERVKEDISDIKGDDIDEFLSAINGKTFKYKDESLGKGKRPGAMVQDVEHTKLGKMVSTEEGGIKGFDKDKLTGLMLAALAHLADKKD